MFNSTRLKVQLKLAINRLKILQNKKTELNKKTRRDIGELLQKGKEESARIRIELVIRDDFIIEAMEILELHCDLLLARFGLLESEKSCNPSIEVTVNTLIWVAPQLVEAKELSLVRDQLASKFGKGFMLSALEEPDKSDPKVVMKFSMGPPDSDLVEHYLEEIARAYDINWESSKLKHDDEEEINLDEGDDTSGDSDNGGGGQAEQLLTGLDESDNLQFELPPIPTGSPFKKPTTNAVTATTTTSTDNNVPSSLPPPVAPASSSPVKNLNDYDTLAKRLEALRNK